MKILEEKNNLCFEINEIIMKCMKYVCVLCMCLFVCEWYIILHFLPFCVPFNSWTLSNSLLFKQVPLQLLYKIYQFSALFNPILLSFIFNTLGSNIILFTQSILLFIILLVQRFFSLFLMLYSLSLEYTSLVDNKLAFAKRSIMGQKIQQAFEKKMRLFRRCNFLYLFFYSVSLLFSLFCSNVVTIFRCYFLVSIEKFLLFYFHFEKFKIER